MQPNARLPGVSLVAEGVSYLSSNSSLYYEKLPSIYSSDLIYPFISHQFPDISGQTIWQYGFVHNGQRYVSMQFVNQKTVYGNELEDVFVSDLIGGGTNGWTANVHAWTNGRCCFADANGTGIYTSSDGIQFTRGPNGLNGNDAGQSRPFLPGVVTWNIWSQSTTFGITMDGGQTAAVRTKPTNSYVCLGNGVLLAFVPNSTSYSVSSDYGQNWTAKTAPANSFNSRIEIAVSPSGMIVVTSDLINGCWVSTDNGNTFNAKNWQFGTSTKIIYFNGYWVVTGYTGTGEVFFISEDGIHYSYPTPTFTKQLFVVPSGHERYLSTANSKLFIGINTAGTGYSYIVNSDFSSYAQRSIS